MANKIKITEGQLKKLVASKQKIQEQESSETMGEGTKVYLVAVEMNDEQSGYNTNNEYDLTKAAVFTDMDMAIKYRQSLEDSFGGDESKHVFMSTLQLNPTIGQPNLENNDEYGEDPMTYGEPPSIRDIDMVNESIEKIKSEFNRFL